MPLGRAMIGVPRKVWRVALAAIAILVPLGFFFGLWRMGGGHTYHSQALAYIDSAQKVLIAHGLCQDKNDCGQKQMLFGTGGAVRLGPYEWGGVQLAVYEVASAEVVGDLVKALAETYKSLKGPAVTLHVYQTRHLEPQTQFAAVKLE